MATREECIKAAAVSLANCYRVLNFYPRVELDPHILGRPPDGRTAGVPARPEIAQSQTCHLCAPAPTVHVRRQTPRLKSGNSVRRSRDGGD